MRGFSFWVANQKGLSSEFYKLSFLISILEIQLGILESCTGSLYENSNVANVSKLKLRTPSLGNESQASSQDAHA